VKKSLFLIVLIFCIGCGPKIKTPSDTLVVGLATSPKQLEDPRIVMADATASRISRLIFSNLFRVNEKMEFVPDLVETYQFLPPLTYRLNLRKGVLFHDGTELTAQDVKKTIEAIQSPETLSPHRGTMEKIKSVRVTSKHSLTLTLKEPFAPIFAALAFGILPEGKKVGVGSGPYQIEEFVPSQKVVLVRNEGYFGEKPKLKKLIFRIIPDDNVRVLELIGGKVDLLQNNIPPALIDSLQQRKNLVVQTDTGINYSYLGMNLEVPPLDDARVREAIARAIDIPELIKHKMAGFAEPANSLLSPIHWAYEEDTVKYPFDPEQAKTLLDQAGYPDPDGAGPKPRFALSYKTSTKKDTVGRARLIARYLKEVGIDVKVTPYEWGTFFGDIKKGNFQLYSLTWVGLTEPDIFHYVFHSSQTPPVGANRGRFKNSAVDQLTEEGRKVMNRDKRKELYSYVQKVVAQELPYINLWYEKNVAVYQKNLKGVRLRPDAGFEVFTEIYKQ